MNEKRRFRRSSINTEDGREKIEVSVEGKPVQLMNYSVGGLYVISEKLFPKDKVVKLSIERKDKRKIDLIGKVVRIDSVSETKSWGIAIDLLRTYQF